MFGTHRDPHGNNYAGGSSLMRPQIRSFVAACAACLDLAGPLVEIGAKRHPSQDRLANLRTLFPGREFIGCDMEDGPGVDRLENLEKLTFADGEVGTFILCDTLEHVQDLTAAMNELKRCLNPSTGILVSTSVMLFPVHGFPNDYWRFTPEGFRELGKDFPWAATFYGGDPNFPHTVAMVAARKPLSREQTQKLVRTLGVLPPAPHYADAKSTLMLSALGQIVVNGARSSGVTELPAEGDLGPLSVDAWVLAPGTWIKAALPADGDFDRLELMAAGKTLQTVLKADWNVLVDGGANGPQETAFQFDPVLDVHEGVCQLELSGVSRQGRKRLVARSRSGVILPHADLPRGFILHVLDNRYGQSGGADELGRLLVAELRGRGEQVVVDLGCGFRKAGSIGIDATRENTDADLICLLGFDPLPFDDGTVDEVVCRDFLEHIPKAVFLESRGRLHYPVMHLLDEIWRVLRPGGMFRSWTPMFPHPEVFQDPTHLSAWTIKSMDYFCGLYPGAKKIYGIKACFEKVDVREEGFYLFSELRKPLDSDL
ncbi:MAG: class I SAM-dependent methyltransferase [Proteobacteria bacterium]|nr:class I SAM-dependent methyltransferase [Pseudomonadota bacterium]